MASAIAGACAPVKGMTHLHLKKRLIGLLLAALLLSQAITVFAFSGEDDDVSAKYVVLMEAASGTVLYSKNADEIAFPASTTKIMTCIVALENGDLDEEVTVGNEIDRFTSGSSLMKITVGEKLKLRDLLYGLMLVSGNDAAATIAVHLGGSIEGFADMMNAKAAELGLKDTHFVNPHGVHKEDHVTTAMDMAKLTAYALKNDTFRKIVATKQYEVEPTNRDKDGYLLENTNLLVNTTTKAAEKNLNYVYEYAIGVKTGDTDYAKRCLVGAAEKNGITLISVQLYDADNYTRFTEAETLFEWGFSNFVSKDVSQLNIPTTVDVAVANASFEGTEGGSLTLNVDFAGKTVACSQEDWERIANNVSEIKPTVMPLAAEISAPVAAGEKVATVVYKFEGNTLFEADAYASADVQAMTVAVETPDLPSLAGPRTAGSSGPWLFILLIIAVVAIIVVAVIILRNRKRSRRRRNGRRGTYAYRGR